ncbi:hypothetical protein [Paenarthrobacter sp. NPDC058040]|uniref:hypothetical protein n=1 Tax=Paenarthrobacter sp. NPDC058040 TaxID=3346309 RepID=UPI0036DEA036
MAPGQAGASKAEAATGGATAEAGDGSASCAANTPVASMVVAAKAAANLLIMISFGFDELQLSRPHLREMVGDVHAQLNRRCRGLNR